MMDFLCRNFTNFTKYTKLIPTNKIVCSLGGNTQLWTKVPRKETHAGASNVSIEVIGSGAPGEPASFWLNTKGIRYNLIDLFQRYCATHFKYNFKFGLQ